MTPIPVALFGDKSSVKGVLSKLVRKGTVFNNDL